MSQHDYVIDNQSAPAARADINSVLQAIASINSGATAPIVTYANMFWYDTTTKQLKKRNEGNSAWIVLGTVNEGTGTFTPNFLLTTTEVAPATLVLSTEGIAGNNNNTTIPTSAAVKAYADSAAASAVSGIISANTTNVLAATAGATQHAVGTYNMMGQSSSGASFILGTNYSGVLSVGFRDSPSVIAGAAMAGTWKAMAQVTGSSALRSVVLGLRVA